VQQAVLWAVATLSQKLKVHGGWPMNIELVTDAPLKYFVVDDFLSPELAGQMIDEICRLREQLQPGRMRDQRRGQQPRAIEDQTKRNLECFLDAVFAKDRSASVILNNLGQHVFSPKLQQAYRDSGDMLFSYLLVRANFDQTHLAAWGPGHYYRKHVDLPPCFLTANVMLSTEPQKFRGGDFEIFWSQTESTVVPFRPRRMVLFPSAIPHCVTDIEMADDVEFRDWRFTLQYWPHYRA